MSGSPRNTEELLLKSRGQKKLKFLYFWGHSASPGNVTKACFSQWWAAPFVVEGERYKTAEHFMMAEKARLFGDEEIRREIIASNHPKQTKALGRRVRRFDEAEWAAARSAIVVAGNHAKFSQNPDLARFLISTGDRVLVEASPVDRIWGIGLAEDDPRAADPARWRGLNLLGFALMEVRELLAGTADAT